MWYWTLRLGTLVIVCELALAACGPIRYQARTDGYGAEYTQFGRD